MSAKLEDLGSLSTYPLFPFFSGHLDATNLFNGDEELSKSTLKVLNDEWDTLSVDVEPKLTQAADRAFKKFAQKIWDVIPYDLLINID